MSNVGCEGGVAASATLTLVEVGASGVIEKGTGHRQHPQQWRGAVSTTSSTLRRYSVSHVDGPG